jgi:hypothetical protein
MQCDQGTGLMPMGASHPNGGSVLTLAFVKTDTRWHISNTHTSINRETARYDSAKVE